MARRPIPEAEYLRQLLDYDPETGQLRWKPRNEEMFSAGNTSQAVRCRAWNNRYAGQIAGTIFGTPPHNYISVTFLTQEGKRKFLAHRIIWTMVTGEPPTHDIDHRDGDGSNNRWRNLRAATHAQNMRNVRRLHPSTSRFKGVYFAKREGKWQAYITAHGTRLALGYHATEEGAARAYDQAAKRVHGEFAHFNFPAGSSKDAATP